MVGGGIPALLVAPRGQLRARGRGRLLVGHAGCLSRCLPSRERDSRLGVMTAECSASRAGMGAELVDGRRLSCFWMARWLCSIEGWAGTRKSRSGGPRPTHQVTGMQGSSGMEEVEGAGGQGGAKRSLSGVGDAKHGPAL